MKIDKDVFRLEHILDSANKIIELTTMLHSFQNFSNQWIQQDAMLRNFEIIGEASNHISPEIKQNYPDVEWEAMRGMRNFIIHEYFGVDIASVWNTALNDIPILKNQIIKILEDLKKSPYICLTQV